MAYYPRPTKFCANCKFFVALTSHTKNASMHHQNCTWYLDLVTGAPEARSAKTERANEKGCGTEGRYWEEKERRETAVRHRE